MIGDRYKYKSSICRVLDTQTDTLNRVFVYWENEYFSNWVDVTESSYRKIFNNAMHSDGERRCNCANSGNPTVLLL